MTAPADEAPRPKRRLKVEPEPGGQLEQLLIAGKAAADAEKAASEAAEEYKAAVKRWLLSLFPDPDDLPDAFDIVADPHGRYPAYAMTLKGGFRVDSTAMKKEDPETYVRWARKIQPTWELRPVSTGGRGRRRG